MKFHRLIHSDWSLHPAGRATATATRTAEGWRVDTPEPTGDLDRFVDRLCDPAQRTLAGFDFPIGLPAAFGARIGLPDFPDALTKFGTGEWSDFFTVARDEADISIRRPFYPDAPGGRSHRQLLDGLGVPAITDLLRDCERANTARGTASPLFWTMGAKQVGKAAITGWRDVLRKAKLRGARLWPFDGHLHTLVRTDGAILAETYPAEAYGHVGIRFGPGASKRRQSDRASFAPILHAWASRNGVAFTPALAATLDDGFGPAPSGEDPFDALAGLLGMIEVADGRRAAAPDDIDRVWEGWILGQHR
jgi:hypothetical protein